MIPYVGCEHARELLEGLVDGELSVADQVAVESHLRWCSTCSARVEDLRLIGASVRLGSPVQRQAGNELRSLSAIQEAVLIRVCTEREDSIRARVVELFTDMRLWGPALGATAAMLLCVAVAFAMLHRVTTESPESMAAMFETLAPPGSEQNPLRPANDGRVDGLFEKYMDSRFAGGISMPRVLDDGAGLAEIGGGSESVFALATVVTREGRIANYEVLHSDSRDHVEAARRASHVDAVRDAVRLSRFAPAQTPVGRAVAVNMVWLIVSTTATAQKTGHHSTTVVAPVVVQPRPAQPATPTDVPPPVSQSEEGSASATV